MTPRQRMLAAIRGEPADRLPSATYNCHWFSWGDHAGCPEYVPILRAVRRTGAAVLCKVRPESAGGLPEPALTRTFDGAEQVTTAVLETPKGPLRRVLRKPPGQPARCVEHYLKTDQDIARFLSIEPSPVRWEIDGLLARCEEIGQAGLAYLDYPDPFGTVASLFDQENFLLRVQTDAGPLMELIEQAFRHAADSLRRLLELLSGPRPTVLFYTCGPELATPPLLGPDVFARMVTPYQARLAEMIHERGFAVSLHCHGRVRQVLSEILKCSFDVLEPIEPPPQGDIDLAGLRSAVQGRTTLMGYVQDQDFYMSRPEQIRDHLAAIVAAIGGDGRYIATPTCTPFAFPPPPQYVSNYVAFLEAAAELGA